MTRPTIRPYRPEDAAALGELFHAAVHAIPDAVYGAAQREAWAPSPPDLRARFAVAPPDLALLDGSVVGFMSLEGDGHLDMAYVHPDYQRRGVALALYQHLEDRARSLRLARVFAEVSHAARPFFERNGFSVTRTDIVERSGQRLGNSHMEKRLVEVGGRGRLFVLGNSGAGKTTLAERLASELGRARVDLDSVAFVDQLGTRRAIDASLALLGDDPALTTAVVDGCYADLMEALATEGDHLIWLDPPVEHCQENARSRPWEPHKWPSAEEQDAFLPHLLAFIGAYAERSDATGRPAHARLFEAFPGTKERHMGRESLPLSHG